MNKTTGLIKTWIETKATQEELKYIKAFLDARIKPDIQEVMEEVNQHIRDGQMLSAVKLYKDLMGVGLKEAKDKVDAMRDQMSQVKKSQGQSILKQSISGINTHQVLTGPLSNAGITMTLDPYPHLTTLSEQYKLMQK